MSRLTLLAMCLCAILAIAFASPLPSNTTVDQSTGSYSGIATYFDVGLGACGHTDTNADHIVALGLKHYRGNCNKMIHITNTKNGKTATAKVRDLCESCGLGAGTNIDLAPSVFSSIGAMVLGELDVQWYFM
ncbi:hypothetical protein PILCRDRAFT_138065 [Piloderma croceum F 1598]|uniref:RlpA-like protein double-psi beta-barrel domain-containing protein n=1 Tax=Piloderma croceum (strain F 1598) TaxID=765440 RepID=A0A0C3CPX0_PILCF|nr:hypothetical protein PILCRDRAFT_138065 [Piloderma croceum F 1598]